MSQYGNDIRKISRYEYLLKLIRQAQTTADQAKKEAITGTRSIAYINSQNLVNNAIQGALGATKPNNLGITNPQGNTVGTGLGDGESGAVTGASSALNSIKEGGTTSEIASLDNTIKEGWYDVQSVLDGAIDSFGKPPPPAGTNRQISTLTGLKTSDGRQLAVHFDDAGHSFIAPSNWDNPFSPGPDPTYTAGRTWALTSGATKYFAPGFYGLVATRRELDNTQAYEYNAGVVAGPPVVGNSIIFSNAFNLEPGDGVSGTVYAFQSYSPGVAIALGHYGQQECGLDAGDTVSCSADPPPETNWTDLDITQLAWVTPITALIQPLIPYEKMGRFIPNPYDVNVPVEYKDGSSILDLETMSGDPLRIGPTRDGGWYIYYRDGSNNPLGAADANSVFLLNQNKTSAGFITPNQLTTMLPI